MSDSCDFTWRHFSWFTKSYLDYIQSWIINPLHPHMSQSLGLFTWWRHVQMLCVDEYGFHCTVRVSSPVAHWFRDDELFSRHKQRLKVVHIYSLGAFLCQASQTALSLTASVRHLLHITERWKHSQHKWLAVFYQDWFELLSTQTTMPCHHIFHVSLVIWKIWPVRSKDVWTLSYNRFYLLYSIFWTLL